MESGEKLTGHMVIGSDDVWSRARERVMYTSINLEAVDSPYFDRGSRLRRYWRIHNSPRTKIQFAGWIEQDVHFFLATFKGGKHMLWVLTHKVCTFGPCN